jgi:hypothetical protein
MKQSREAFPIRSPAKVCSRIQRPFRGPIESRPPALEKPAKDASDCRVLDGLRRFAFATPHGLVRIREDRINDVAEARSGVAPVFLVELLVAEVRRVSQIVTPRRKLYRSDASSNARMTMAGVVEMMARPRRLPPPRSSVQEHVSEASRIEA